MSKSFLKAFSPNSLIFGLCKSLQGIIDDIFNLSNKSSSFPKKPERSVTCGSNIGPPYFSEILLIPSNKNLDFLCKSLKKLFEDIVNKKNAPDPYRLLHRISKVKDINKLSELVPDPYKKLELQKFFSSDILDLRWIPKFKRKRNTVESVDYNKKFDSLKNL